MAHFAVTAFGADRPGIVAAVTRVFVDLGCNLEDTSMTILRGHFAMMLVVEAPPGVGAAELESGLASPASALDLVVAVRPIPELAPEAVGAEAGRGWTVSVYGADRPGIVAGVAGLLAEESMNIVDLDTRVIGEPDRPVYAMILDVALPAGADPQALDRRLQAVASELGVTATLHPSEADIL
ncbi:MAG: ACT domain-containing protein [Actinomycetota bacterium]|nr:ACT domain-containing protein [Actinomycetota bacterium]